MSHRAGMPALGAPQAGLQRAPRTRRVCQRCVIAVRSPRRCRWSAACARCAPALTLCRPQTCSSQRPANVYDVRRYTPPQEDLGVVTLPENMQNGDSLELNGKNWVVSRVSTRFKLLRGRYRKDGARLFVTETSRWLVDGFLQQLYEKP